MSNLPSVSAVIVTYNRPDELSVAIRSILTQTVRPVEVLVLDDGATLPGMPHAEELAAAGIRPVFHRNTAGPDLTAMRNLGAELSTGEIVAYLDDDVELFPDYFERLLEVYARDPGRRIGGVGGFVVNPKPMTWRRRLRWWINVLFLNAGFREGRVLPSGFCTDLFATPRPITAETEVDFFMGATSSFRREVFDHERFTPGYHAYALDEDKDFSRRVSLRRPLVTTPLARLYHFESPRMRPDRENYSRRFIIGRYLFFINYERKSPWQWPLFWWAAFGYFLCRAAYALAKPDANEAARLRGILGAVRDILAGRDLRRPLPPRGTP
ncbi:MAG: glycosyltransferase [Thermodesulfobacteriota bacterium]